MDRHLVPVKIRVVRCTDQWVQLNCLAFHQHRLKSLDTQTMQRRRPVQKDRMLADDFFKDVPNFRLFGLHKFFGLLNRRRETAEFELAVNKRTKQFERHLFGQTTLMKLQRRSHHDDRAAGVVDALAQQVLTKAPLLAFDHVGKRFQLTTIRPSDGFASSAVVEQRIDRFLKHPLFVAYDDVRGIKIKKSSQPVITVNHPTVKIIEIRRRKAAPFQGHKRTQVGRQDRQRVHNHPLGLVAGV